MSATVLPGYVVQLPLIVTVSKIAGVLFTLVTLKMLCREAIPPSTDISSVDNTGSYTRDETGPGKAYVRFQGLPNTVRLGPGDGST